MIIASSLFAFNPWWYYPPAYYSPADYPPGYYPQPVVVPESSVYIQGPSPGQLAPGFWYYCESAQGYYPDVQTCAEPWIQVPPKDH